MQLVQREPMKSIVIMEVFDGASAVIFAAKKPGVLGVRRALTHAAKTADSLIVICDAGKIITIERKPDDPDMSKAIIRFMNKMFFARDIVRVCKAIRIWGVMDSAGRDITIAQRRDGRFFMRYQNGGSIPNRWREHDLKFIDGLATWEGKPMIEFSTFPHRILLPM